MTCAVPYARACNVADPFSAQRRWSIYVLGQVALRLLLRYSLPMSPTTSNLNDTTATSDLILDGPVRLRLHEYGISSSNRVITIDGRYGVIVHAAGVVSYLSTSSARVNRQGESTPVRVYVPLSRVVEIEVST